MEEWRPVPGWGGRYIVSSLGRVASVHKTWLAGSQPEHLRYPYIQLCDGTERRKKSAVHRLVCSAFNGPPPTPGHVVGHRDGNPQNNIPSNLRWVTPAENSQDMIAHGNSQHGVKALFAKLNVSQVHEIRRRYAAGEPRVQIAAAIGVSDYVVFGVVTGKHYRRD